ncbi:MAG TPA: hypothetical protein VN578_22270 [Candidatus Binatia bacterium]|jgi:probable HAF family extracellular repeat protein|nr:hypothetical protein [Candidatus Binatia bacterium]
MAPAYFFGNKSYSNGKFTHLGAPAGTTTSAAAINSIGQIVGTIIFNSGAPEHAALYSNGVWTDLGGYPGAMGTSASGINTAGQIIGVAGFKVTSYHPVEADLNRPETLKSAFEGAHGVFLVTNPREKGADEREQQLRRYTRPRMPGSNI